MSTLAYCAYLDSEFGIPQELPHVGSALENCYVFNDAATDLKSMAEKGLVKIVFERTNDNALDSLIDKLIFVRLR